MSLSAERQIAHFTTGLQIRQVTLHQEVHEKTLKEFSAWTRVMDSYGRQCCEGKTRMLLLQKNFLLKTATSAPVSLST